MGEKHINATEWERYLRGELPVAELLAVDDHVSACPACREQFTDAAANIRGVRQIRHEFEGSAHLSFEQLERFVEGRGSREERALTTVHTAHCSSCKDELGDLVAYARSSRSTRPRLRWIGAAAALVIASGLTLPWLRQHRSDSTNLDRQPPAVHRSEPPRSESSAPSKLGPIAGQREVQLGGTSTTDVSVFGLVEPIGTRVVETRPVLRWSAAPGAQYYLVQVFDANFRLAASSPHLSQTEWRVSHPLKPGQIYSWQVTAKQAGKTVTAPQPPAPQALFEVDRNASPMATKPAQ